MRIEINDMFALRRHKLYPNQERWQLYEWVPCDYSTLGRYKPISKRVEAPVMMGWLVDLECPQEALEAFREAAGIDQGTGQDLPDGCADAWISGMERTPRSTTTGD